MLRPVLDDAAKEYLYRELGEVFDRPFPEPLPRWDDVGRRGTDLWATEHETRQQIVDRCRRVWAHSDATVGALALDSPGHVPWWPRPDVTLFAVLVHLLTETTRHAGHADILRERPDGRTAAVPPRDAAFWATRRATVERAARAAGGEPVANAVVEPVDRAAVEPVDRGAN